jgi:Ca2+-binding EF-hand superfamily protein
LTTPEDHLKRVRRLSEGFDLLFSAIRSTSHKKDLKRAMSSLHKRGTSKKMSNILDEYDVEVNGEQEPGFCVRLFGRHQSTQARVGNMQSFRFSIAETNLFEDNEKETYTAIFDRTKDNNAYRVSKEQFEDFLRSIGFDDVVGLDFACKSFQLLDLSNAGGCLDLDQWIAFMKISKHMASIRRPIIKFFHFVDVNQRRSIDMHDLDSALMYLALPPLRTEDRERLSKLCNADDELEFEVRRTCIRIVSITGLEYVTHSCIFNLQVLVNLVTIFKLRSIIKEYQKKRKCGVGFDESIHSALTN